MVVRRVLEAATLFKVSWSKVASLAIFLKMRVLGTGLGEKL